MKSFWSFKIFDTNERSLGDPKIAKKIMMSKQKTYITAAARQNQQNDLGTQQRLRSAWESAQSHMKSVHSIVGSVPR